MKHLKGSLRPAAILALALMAELGVAAAAHAGGLRCSIGEVVLNNLKIGQAYSLETLANLPLSVTNTGDQAVHVQVAPLIPGAGELKQEAEPLPSASWAAAEPDTFLLAPQETRAVALKLAIPDDPRLFGRKFEVIFWSHTLALPGDLLAYGLKSRVIFTIDSTRAAGGIPPAGDLGIEILPAQITFEKVAPGRDYRLNEASGQTVVIHNTSSRKLSLEVKALSPGESQTDNTEGCGNLLSTADVTLAPSRFELEPGAKQTVSGVLRFHKGRMAKGEKFMCTVSASVVDLPVHTEIYSRIYAIGR